MANERFAVLVVNFVNGADIWVVQGGRRTCLALESAECLRVFGYLVGQELEGDEATKFDILSLIDHTHSATAEFLDDAVVRDGLTDELRGTAHWRKY
jgi:hypothetical protein